MLKQTFLVLLIGFSILFSFHSFAQVNMKDSTVFTPVVDFSYAYKVPSGDLSDRFGDHSEIGVGFLLKTKKNFLFGLDWNYLFGSDVKDLSFADGFRDDQGFILGNNGLYSEIYFVERGFTLSAKVGKVFGLLAPNPNSGIAIMLGVGFMQHRVQMEDKFQEVPLLSGDDYYPGYDKLTNGVMFTEFIGYRLLSNRRLVNVFGGFEFTQAITKNRRKVDYDTGINDNKTRLDLTLGFRIGLSVPLYKPTPKDFYYN